MDDPSRLHSRHTPDESKHAVACIERPGGYTADLGRDLDDCRVDDIAEVVAPGQPLQLDTLCVVSLRGEGPQYDLAVVDCSICLCSVATRHTGDLSLIAPTGT